MPFGPGETFERYSIEALIGRGGMGEVYRAIDTRLRRKVALKVIRPDKDRPDAAARLYREARAAAALSHPNAVSVHDVGEAEGVFYIVMELVVGQPLLAFVGDARVTVQKKIAWLTDVARAIGAAHRAGIIHRDVKPANVMVSEDGFAKVLDFGLARPLGPIDPVSFRTQEGRVLGTLRYMAPEQVVGAEADARSDQYAFGLTAYELLAGTHPGGALIETKPKLADEVAADVPHDVALVLQRTLARNPDERYASMDDVVKALEAALSTPRAAPPFMTPPPFVASPGADETAETMSAQKQAGLGLGMNPSTGDALGAAPTLAALAKGADPAATKVDATLISKQAPSALTRAPVDKTLPLAGQPPIVVPQTLVSGKASPLAQQPVPQPPPQAAPHPSTRPPAMPHPSTPPPRSTSVPPSRAPSTHRMIMIAASVGVLAVAAFAGTYLGSRNSTAPAPSSAPVTVTVTSSTASASAALPSAATADSLEAPASASVAPLASTSAAAPTPTPTHYKPRSVGVTTR